MTTLLEINLNSRSGGKAQEPAFRALKALGPVKIVELEHPKALSKAVEALGSDLARIVLGGGDGTVYFALETLLEAGVQLGILLLGTANDLARSLDLPLDPVDAAKRASLKRIRSIDVGRFNDGDFIISVGLGVVPRLNRALDEERKESFGVLAYLKTFLQVSDSDRSPKVRLISDEGERKRSCLQINIGNGPRYGGGMTISSDTSLSDGLLTVLCNKPRGFLSPVRQSLLLRFGPDPAESQPESLDLFKTHSLRVETNKTVKVTADGEEAGETPLYCEVLSGALDVYC